MSSLLAQNETLKNRGRDCSCSVVAKMLHFFGGKKRPAILCDFYDLRESSRLAELHQGGPFAWRPMLRMADPEGGLRYFSVAIKG